MRRLLWFAAGLGVGAVGVSVVGATALRRQLTSDPGVLRRAVAGVGAGLLEGLAGRVRPPPRSTTFR